MLKIWCKIFFTLKIKKKIALKEKEMCSIDILYLSIVIRQKQI